MVPGQRRNHRTRQLLAISCAVLAATALTACGSSSGSASASSGSTQTSGATSPPNSATGQFSALQSVVDKAMVAPTSIPLTTPLQAAPPKGKTIVYLQCEVAQCKEGGEGVAQATAALGWTLNTIPFQSTDPATLASAFQQALQQKPLAVVIAGVPEVLWKNQEAAYQKAGIPIIPFFVGPIDLSSTVIANIGNLNDNAYFGKVLADWFVVDSHGTGHALVANVPAYQVLTSVSDAFEKEVASQCAQCTITKLDVTATQLGTGAFSSVIISALQKDPSIKYVMATDGVFIDPLPAALAGAGLGGTVKVIAQGGDAQNIIDLKAGRLAALTGLPSIYAGWLSLDVALRHYEGMSMPADGGDGGVPTQLLTKASVGSVTGSFELPTDFRDQIKKLWLLG
jgi:ribose transport system substrate-binding protein